MRINLVADTTITLNAFINTNPAKYRAIVVLDGSCSVCLETLMAWKRISDSLSISLKKIIFIGHNASKTELEYALQTSGDTNIPLFNDSFYLFGTKNKIQKGKPQTFLVNNNWQILETGDPLSNPSMLNKYTQKLKK
ncbi:MAG TPA: hypothetical protein VFN30_07480 [Chitinophagaceae bacterium]|nr:hypothetical protein [Chitinophagaceae bacterium]